jgi:hypothetical protein
MGYAVGSHLEVPGIEATLEYGDASRASHDRIPGAMLINDQSSLDRVRVTQIDGLHDDPDATETRQGNSDHHGENAGLMLYRGRTVGLTGRSEAGNVGAMRNNWRRFRGQFGIREQDLLIHHPFEVLANVNEWINPVPVDNYGWIATNTTIGGANSAITVVADGITTAGSVTMTGATSSGKLIVYGHALDAITNTPQVTAWDGEEVWLFADMKVFAASGTVSAMGLAAAQWNYHAPVVDFGYTATDLVSTASPATGAWKTLAFRLTSANLSEVLTGVNPTHLTPQLSMSVAAGTYTMHWRNVAMVFLRPDDPTPVGYFDGNTSGFVWLGRASRSRSKGPTHAENKIPDPRFEERVLDSQRVLTRWGALTGFTFTGTINLAPRYSPKWSGDHVHGSAYFKATTTSATSQSMGLEAIAANGNHYVSALEGRLYRLSMRVNVVSKPVTGTLRAELIWMDEAGTTISTSSSDVVPVGESDVAVTATAPARTFAVKVAVRHAAVVTSSAALEIYVSDPCLVDISDWDPGKFYGMGDLVEEVANRRRIPRPFLLRGARKTSDMKAPEQQSRSRAWRDFTMSLRAADPRLYVVDRNRRALQLIGTPNLISFSMSPLVVAGTEPSTPPAWMTAEGQSGTTGWRYGTQSMFTSMPMMSIGDATNAAGAQPAAVAIQRAYRSIDVFTYTNPLIVMHGHFQMRWVGGGASGNLPAWGFDGTGFSYNTFGALVKRVSSSQWLELRINSSNNIYLSRYRASPPYTVELWSSHNTSGTAAVSRLAQWDVLPSSPVADPMNGPMIVSCQIDANNVFKVDITFVNTSGATIVSLSKTYSLPSPLVSLFGSGVAGRVGEYVRADNWAHTSSPGGDFPYPVGWSNMTSQTGFPWISYFSARELTSELPVVRCPVIGDVDTPQTIELRGDVVDPILTLSSTLEDGTPITSEMRLVGTVTEDNPLIIDTDKWTVYDSTGANRYSMVVAGSLHHLQPGVNDLQVVSTSWGAYPEHAVVSWRDALV